MNTRKGTALCAALGSAVALGGAIWVARPAPAPEAASEIAGQRPRQSTQERLARGRHQRSQSPSSSVASEALVAEVASDEPSPPVALEGLVEAQVPSAFLEEEIQQITHELQVSGAIDRLNGGGVSVEERLHFGALLERVAELRQELVVREVEALRRSVEAYAETHPERMAKLIAPPPGATSEPATGLEEEGADATL